MDAFFVVFELFMFLSMDSIVMAGLRWWRRTVVFVGSRYWYLLHVKIHIFSCIWGSLNTFWIYIWVLQEFSISQYISEQDILLSVHVKVQGTCIQLLHVVISKLYHWYQGRKCCGSSSNRNFGNGRRYCGHLLFCRLCKIFHNWRVLETLSLSIERFKQKFSSFCPQLDKRLFPFVQKRNRGLPLALSSAISLLCWIN